MEDNRITILLSTVVDEFARECLEIRVEPKMDSRHVLETLDELMRERQASRYTRSDNGAEFVSRRLTEWLAERGCTPVFIEPGESVGEWFCGEFSWQAARQVPQ